MGVIRKPMRNKVVKKAPVFIIKKGVKFQVLNVGGTIMEIRVPDQTETKK